MIIWSRWGFVVFLFFGVGVGLGFLLKALVGIGDERDNVTGVFVGVGFMLSGALLWLFSKYVVGTRIDRRRPAIIWEKLAVPVTHENGAVQTQRAVPLLHPTSGEQLYTNPVSTFFFIPIRFWAYILPAVGLAVFAGNLVALLAGRR